jgi:hypothetical protein
VSCRHLRLERRPLRARIGDVECARCYPPPECGRRRAAAFLEHIQESLDSGKFRPVADGHPKASCQLAMPTVSDGWKPPSTQRWNRSSRRTFCSAGMASCRTGARTTGSLIHYLASVFRGTTSAGACQREPFGRDAASLTCRYESVPTNLSVDWDRGAAHVEEFLHSNGRLTRLGTATARGAAGKSARAGITIASRVTRTNPAYTSVRRLPSRLRSTDSVAQRLMDS